MEVAGTQNSRDDRPSAGRSFGSNYNPCSQQSRKISIGVMVDSLVKPRPKPTNEHEFSTPTYQKTYRKLNTVGDLSERGQAKANVKGNQMDKENNTSPWVSPKSTLLRKPTKDSPAGGGSELHRSHVEMSANQKLPSQSNIDTIKEGNRVYSRRKGDKEGERETRGLPSATAQEAFVSEKVVAEDTTAGPEDRRQVLKMKLWEILGAKSPNKQASQSPEMGVNNLNPEPDVSRKYEAVAKPKQNSDTIESDSQSPDHTIKRAVTRSLARKKVASKAPTPKTRNVRKSTSTKKSLEKNIFSFNEGQFGKGHDGVAGHSPKSNGKNQGRKGSKVEARKINFFGDLNAGEVQPQRGTSKIAKGAEKISSFGNSMRSRQSSPPKNHNEFVVPEKRNKENRLSNKNGGKGLKGEAHRFSFPDKLISDEDQPAINVNETVRGAKKSSLTGNRTTSCQNITPQKNSTFVGAGSGNQEKGSSLLSGMKRGRNGLKVEGHRISSQNNSKEVQPEVQTSETTNSAKRASADGKRTSSSRSSPPENWSKYVDAENRDQEKDSSLLTATKKLSNLSSLRTSHYWFQQEAFGTSPLKNTMDPQVDLQSPTFEFRTPAETLSPGSIPKAYREELDDQSPRNYSFNTRLNYKLDSYTPDGGTKTPNDTEEAEDSPFTKSGPTRAEKDAEDEVYRSTPEKMDSESSEEVWATKATSPYPNKRFRSQENFKFQHFNPILASPEGMEESDGSQGLPETNEGDGLANAISLLALALQKVKSKIKSVTSKKSTEVLMSVAEEVHSQLQSAESQFEKDVGKITSLNKSNRKHLETEFEEQQEQLKVIYQKFKADVSQHIQEHRSKVEGLQGQEKELRLFMEKRKASHEEVLKQLEDSIQVKLSDAETRIAAFHKTGREKMLQLQQALGKCLKEGMLG